MNRKFWLVSLFLPLFIILLIAGCERNPVSSSDVPSGITGIYYYEITWEPHGWSFLRFFNDGAVINNNTNFGLTPQEGWGDIQSLLTLDRVNENWHGVYQLDGDRLVFTLYPPADYPFESDGVTSKCQFTGEKVIITKINDEDNEMEYLLLQP
jgi:hypothetical protein